MTITSKHYQIEEITADTRRPEFRNMDVSSVTESA